MTITTCLARPRRVKRPRLCFHREAAAHPLLSERTTQKCLLLWALEWRREDPFPPCGIIISRKMLQRGAGWNGRGRKSTMWGQLHLREGHGPLCKHCRCLWRRNNLFVIQKKERTTRRLCLHKKVFSRVCEHSRCKKIDGT